MNSNTTSKSLLSSPLSEYLTINPFKLSFLESFLPNYNPTMWDTLVKKMMSFPETIEKSAENSQIVKVLVRLFSKNTSSPRFKVLMYV